MLEPSSSEESDLEGEEPGLVGIEASRPGRPIPVLGGRVAGFAGVGAFGFGQTGLAGALNSGGAACLSSNTSSSSLAPSSVSNIVPPSIDLVHQRSHSLSTGNKLISSLFV